jgi:uncharacterized protein (TIGR02145 family)
VVNGAQRQANVPALVNNGGGKVTLNLPAQSYKNAEIALYSVNGKRILHKKVLASSTANAITRKNAAPGAYLLSVSGADGGAFTSRLTHNGGNLDITVSFGGEKLSSSMKLAKEAAAGDWTVPVSAAGRVDSIYTLTPGKGTTPVQNITLRETAPVTPGLGAPENVMAASASATSIVVSWSAVSGAVDYYVYRGTSADGTYRRVLSTSSTTYTNTGLSACTTYYYKVSAYNGGAESPQSAYASAAFELGISGEFIDCRDSKIYKYVTIAGKKWMAENLNFDDGTYNYSWCYNYEADSCTKYGRLYSWGRASGVCPSGWHLPTREEWGDLAIAAGGTGVRGIEGTAGRALKSTTGWKSMSDGRSGGGTDEFGFSALPGGAYYNGFSDVDCSWCGGTYGRWWTATRYGGSGMVLEYSREMRNGIDNLSEFNGTRVEYGSYWFSVRCVGDD